MKKQLLKRFVELTGNRYASALLRKVSSSRLSRTLIPVYSKTYKIDESEIEHPQASYGSLQAYFTRRLHVDARPFDAAPDILVSPADGCASSFGRVKDGHEFTIKGHTYSINQIFMDEKRAAAYKDGFYFVFYLSPADYHHFHYPADGTVTSRYALGTASYPVNNLGLTHGDRPFETNYRLITEISSQYDKLALVKVGALNVNSVQLYSSDKNARKGEDFGYFSFGSTILLFVAGDTPFTPSLASAGAIRTGETIGRWHVHADSSKN
ncbi:phosphatidylserine decarboxylase proenzyme [Sporosarcina sp. NCCP-2716]|uniref:archaetidylserine decarboxylase n=1 Tax=Sporosarcina sp. NCCP-2716 TaxID=2943679 RepID=UPI00203CF515|nr:archaetidylserine decarboxylase [Sporosarcina sp. NCCP-2716]GKV69618.1 phosphatidylserine decarboxylase proenzyme [Sporosarcina sp. NCCP-2716]